jgi:hypothetical protein
MFLFSYCIVKPTVNASWTELAKTLYKMKLFVSSCPQCMYYGGRAEVMAGEERDVCFHSACTAGSGYYYMVGE